VLRVFVPALRALTTHGELRRAGGGVGPHFDSYDVFFSSPGDRRWRVGRQRSRTRPEGAAQGPSQLPRREECCSNRRHALPASGLAHDGVCAGACFTYSIGFRAPSDQEVAREFLAFLQDRVAFDVPTRSGSEASAPPGGGAEKDGATGRRPSPENSLARADVRVFWASTCRTQAQIVFSRRAVALAAGSPRCAAPGACGSTCAPGCCSGSGVLRNGERVEPPGRLRRFLARLATSASCRRASASRCRSSAAARLVPRRWLRIGERYE